MMNPFRLTDVNGWLTRATWAVALVVTGAVARAQVTGETPGWFPFRFSGVDARATAVDLSGLNEKPAGKSGFHRVEGGVIKDGAGRRVRWFGFNFSGEACFPPKETAPAVAARLAKMGVNIVRLHHMDYTWGPGSLIRHPQNDGIRADLLDRLDLFVAELKKQGIYVNLNLHVSRTYPGTPEGFDFSKGLDHFYPPYIDTFKRFARDLVAHRNPYTGLTYAREPAVACIEVNNENTLAMFPLARWATLPEPFAGELRRRWLGWLRSRYRTTESLRASWGVNDGRSGPELIDNPNLEAGARGWVLENHDGARSALGSIPGGEKGVRWTITRTGGENWHLQLNRPGLDLTEGGSYRLSFRARGDAPRPLSVSVMLDQDPWSECGLQTEAQLTKGWQLFSFDFVATGTRPRHVRVNFNALNRLGTIDLSDVSLRPISSGALQPEESFEKENVPLPATSPNRTARRDLVRFLVELERNHASAMHRFLKEELGAQQILYHSQVVYGGMAGALREQRVSDLADTHTYWQHPEFPGRPWDPQNWRIANTSQLADPRGGELVGLALQRVQGMPFTVSEYNIAAPSDYSAEAWPILAAFAGFQDWDGIYLFDYLSFTNDYDAGRIRSFFTCQGHPAHEAFTPVAALLFRRGMVRPATQLVSLQASEERSLADHADKGMWGSFDRFWSDVAISRAAALKHRLALYLVHGFAPTKATVSPELPASGPITSDTGEITWDAGRSRFTLNAPGARILLGKVGGSTAGSGPGGRPGGRPSDLGSASLGDVRFEIAPMGGNEHAHLALVHLDGDPIGRSGRLLLVALGRAENEEMGWNADRTSVGDRWGRGPALVQGVRATVTVPGSWRVEALDPTGLPKQTIATSGASFHIDPAHGTPWYLLTPAR